MCAKRDKSATIVCEIDNQLRNVFLFELDETVYDILGDLSGILHVEASQTDVPNILRLKDSCDERVFIRDDCETHLGIIITIGISVCG